MTRRDYRCPTCGRVEEIQCSLEERVARICLNCGIHMQRYFGGTREMAINYGYRESRYYNDADARIAQYQFTNL